MLAARCSSYGLQLADMRAAARRARALSRWEQNGRYVRANRRHQMKRKCFACGRGKTGKTVHCETMYSRALARVQFKGGGSRLHVALLWAAMHLTR
eukprot:scaffold94953_cov69-Phaeocystis_antarctica.AAC.3